MLPYRRVMLAKKTDMTGVWEADWQFTWGELRGEPQPVEKGLKFELKERKKGFLGIGGSSGKIVQFHDPETNEVSCSFIIFSSHIDYFSGLLAKFKRRTTRCSRKFIFLLRFVQKNYKLSWFRYMKVDVLIIRF